MKKTISIGLFTIGFVIMLGALGAMRNSSRSSNKKTRSFLFDDINDFPIGI
jgi:hypothetical protein